VFRKMAFGGRRARSFLPTMCRVRSVMGRCTVKTCERAARSSMVAA